jgi:DNA-binding XRE family transcriptional regulator
MNGTILAATTEWRPQNRCDAVIAMDQELVVTAWDRGAERLFGWTAHEAVGRPCADVGRSVDLQLRARREADLRRAGWWRGRSALLDRDSGLVVVETECVAVRLEASGVEYVSQMRELTRGVGDGGPSKDPALCGANVVARATDFHGKSALARAELRAVPKATSETAKQRRKRVFAYNLRRVRESRGWTQEELADRAGIGWREQVVHYERQDYEPGPENLEKLCQALEVDERELRTPIPALEPEPC